MSRKMTEWILSRIEQIDIGNKYQHPVGLFGSVAEAKRQYPGDWKSQNNAWVMQNAEGEKYVLEEIGLLG